MAETRTSGSIVGELRRALHHLYDPAGLRQNPLVERFGLAQSADPASALRRLLVEGIEALKPGPEVPLQSNAWRLYHLLFQRYTEQFTQREVATDLGLSIRQLRRHETAALRLLADSLSAHRPPPLEPGHSPAAAPGEPPSPDDSTPTCEQELEWLRKSLPSGPVELREVWQAVLRTVAPLTQALRVRVEGSLPPELPPLAVQQATLRQALLNVVTVAIRCVPGGQVQVQAEARRPQVHLHIRPISSQAASLPPLDDRLESLEMARQLVGLSGGTADLVPGASAAQPFAVRLVLPAAEQVAVLVIDDNADTLQLLERYLVGSRYRFAGAADPEQGLALAAKAHPEIIVLDVMLPGIDGWELLGRLREHPSTRGVPIIICTILPQEPLALGLGAAGFIRKPVTRRALLSALDQQAGLSLRGSG